MTDMLTVLEIKSDTLLGIRLSPRHDIKKVIERIEINMTAKNQSDSINILCDALNDWFNNYPDYIQYNITIGEVSEVFDWDWIKIWDNSFKCFQARIHQKILTEDSLARSLVSDDEKDNPRLQTMAQQVGQDQIIKLLSEKIDTGELKTVDEIRQWLRDV